MEDLEVFEKMNEITQAPQFSLVFGEDSEQKRQIAEHKLWLRSIRHERPQTSTPYRIGVYIRYFNQTKYKDYIAYHKKQYIDSIGLCPRWTLVDFYIDTGSTAPNMESAPEWSRLLNDCFDGKIDLILTQKVSNISKKSYEASFCARILAAQTPPIGIYFISEDLYTLASYYQEDLHDNQFFPDENWEILPDGDNEGRGALHD